MSRGIWSEQGFTGLPSLSVAAHELKSPITLMRQLSLVLQDDGLSSAEKSRYQQQLIATADRALLLTTDLSHAANLQPSLFPLESVNPLAICQSIAREIDPLMKIYDRNIAWPKASRKTTLVVANPRLLGRVVANFIDNALRYTEADIPIRVNIGQSGETVRVGVRDYGPQMTRSDYQRLLSEVEQMKTIRTRPESSGLGIFIASQFARAMQGSIGLIRHRDGVTFYVDLPVSRQTSWL